MLHVFSPRMQSVSLTSSVGSLWTFRNPELPSVRFPAFFVFQDCGSLEDPPPALRVIGLRQAANRGMAFPPRTLRRRLPTACWQQTRGAPCSLSGPRLCSVCGNVLGGAASAWTPGSTLHSHNSPLREPSRHRRQNNGTCLPHR